MKTKKQIEQDMANERTARNVIFILGWTSLTFILTLTLKLLEYPKIYVLISFILIIFIGWLLWRIFIKEKKE